MNRRSWIGSSLLLVTVFRSALAWQLEVYVHTGNRGGFCEPAGADGIGDGGAGKGAGAPSDDHVDRNGVVALRSITCATNSPALSVMSVSHPDKSSTRACDRRARVSVEEAELKAQEAQAALARTVLDRRNNLSHDRADQEEVDRARADRDIALAQIARTKAIIARKTIRAPFRARVGMADLHLASI